MEKIVKIEEMFWNKNDDEKTVKTVLRRKGQRKKSGSR